MQSTESNPSMSDNNPPWPPVVNRETRRRCTKAGHGQFKNINGITACIDCGYVKK